ncbi:dihydrodipicolinate synthase family protein [Limimaricola variabilis]
MTDTPFQGLMAFPITPTDAAGQVLEAPLAVMLDRLRAAGVGSVGLLGSNGGYAYLTPETRSRVLAVATEVLGGAVPLVVNVGAIRTDMAMALAREAEAAGAQGLLMAPVSYTPLTEAEVQVHYASVAGAAGLPLCIYNTPATTGFTFGDALLARLAEVPNVAAVKMPPPAGAVAEDLARLRAALPDSFAIGYSGDWIGAEALAAGADAWFAVAAGLLPGPVMELAAAAQAGRTRAEDRFAPLWALFREYGSFRVMFGIARLMGLADCDPPRPILPIPEAALPRLEAALGAIS